MARNGQSVQDYVVLTLKRAKADLVAFQHQHILKALKEHPKSVSADYFKKMKNERFDLSNSRAVALSCRIELDKYAMLSRSHEVALRTHDPILPLSPA